MPKLSEKLSIHIVCVFITHQCGILLEVETAHVIMHVTVHVIFPLTDVDSLCMHGFGNRYQLV